MTAKTQKYRSYFDYLTLPTLILAECLTQGFPLQQGRQLSCCCILYVFVWFKLSLPPPRICNRRFVFVCLSVSNFAQTLPNGFAWNLRWRLAMGQWTND